MAMQISCRGHLVFGFLVPGLEQDDAVAQALHVVEQVGGQDDAGICIKTREQFADLFRLHGVESRSGFVEDQDGRFVY